MPKMAHFASFWEACGKTELPDKSIFIEQKLVDNAKIEKLKCDILSDFQTLWFSAIEEVQKKSGFW